jgi:hypothetical protein
MHSNFKFDKKFSLQNYLEFWLKNKENSSHHERGKIFSGNEVIVLEFNVFNPKSII